MKYIDRVLQRWRMRKALRFVKPAAKILDIGAWQGEFCDLLPNLREYWGVDPKAEATKTSGRKNLVKGYFPEAMPTQSGFDSVVLLAVLEHIQISEQEKFAEKISQCLSSSGRLIVTVPSPIVDYILAVLLHLRLINGMSLDQHFGFNAEESIALFEKAGLRLIHRERFQLGCNNLFVFEK